MRRAHLFAMLLGLATVGGCLAPAPGPNDQPPTGGDSDGGTTTPAPDLAGGNIGPTCATGRSYTGFSGAQLEADRLVGDDTLDRDRLKPYEVLGDEYQRVLGTRPALIDTLGSTFSSAPPRWYIEPTASAITLYSAYRVAFEGCTTITASDGAYAAAPTATTAPALCTDFATKFWSRTPAQAEIDACVSTAVNDTASETNPRRRWAYTCAAVLSAAGFLTY